MQIIHKLNGDEPLWLIDDVIIKGLVPEGKEIVGNVEMWRNFDGWTLQIIVRDRREE